MPSNSAWMLQKLSGSAASCFGAKPDCGHLCRYSWQRHRKQSGWKHVETRFSQLVVPRELMKLLDTLMRLCLICDAWHMKGKKKDA